MIWVTESPATPVVTRVGAWVVPETTVTVVPRGEKVTEGQVLARPQPTDMGTVTATSITATEDASAGARS